MSLASKPAQVSRTAAGDHEIAVPTLGLSLTQRRLLTLLDSPIPAESLAERSGLPPEKFVRDLGRLASFRLVEGALPEDVRRGATPGDTVTRSAVPMPAAVTIRPAANAPSIAERVDRPGSRGRWLAPAIVAIVAAAGIGYAWQHGSGQTGAAGSAAPRHAPAGTQRANAAPPTPRPAAAPPIAPQSAAASTPRRAEPAPQIAASPAAAAAVAAFRRSEAQSIASNADTRARATAAAKDQPAPRPDAAPRTASPAAAGPAHGKTGQTDVHRADETPAGTRSDAASTMPVTVAPDAAQGAASAASAASTPAAAAPSSRPPAAAVAAHSGAESLAATPAHRAPEPSEAASRADAASSANAASQAAALAPIARVAPDFPTEAIRRRIDSGRVRAQVTVDANGHVSSVAIVSASPRNVFDDAVTTALGKWRFPPGGAGRKADVDVEFRRD